MVRYAHPFGPVADVANRIPDSAKYPYLKSSGREDGLLETPDHRPTMRKMSGNIERIIQTKDQRSKDEWDTLKGIRVST